MLTIWRPGDRISRRDVLRVGTLGCTGMSLADALDVRAVVTTGPAMSADSLPRAANVHVCASAPHSVIMKDAAAVVSHCGHGTVMRALAAGVPIVCMPMGRDQNDNAARVVFHGAGVQLKPSAAAQAIREAIRTVLDRPAYRERARTLGREILKDARESRAVAILEEIAARGAVRSVR